MRSASPITGSDQFTVAVILDYDNKTNNFDSRDMLLALYTSKTLLADDCLDFETYNVQSTFQI